MRARADADVVLQAARRSAVEGVKALQELLRRSKERYVEACKEIERRAADDGDVVAIAFTGQMDLMARRARARRAANR